MAPSIGAPVAEAMRDICRQRHLRGTWGWIAPEVQGLLAQQREPRAWQEDASKHFFMLAELVDASGEDLGAFREFAGHPPLVYI